MYNEPIFFIDAVRSLAKGKYIVAKSDGTVKWKDDAKDVPSDAQILKEKKRLETEYKSLAYSRSRKAEYPTLEECIHAILDDDLASLQEKREAIKTKYPKP